MMTVATTSVVVAAAAVVAITVITDTYMAPTNNVKNCVVSLIFSCQSVKFVDIPVRQINCHINSDIQNRIFQGRSRMSS
jgi:hypothetical protein